MATIHTFVADIVDRIPAMAKDSPDNNRMLLENLTREFLEKCEKFKYPKIDSSLDADVRHLRSEIDCRIEHGASGPGHLEYVRNCLDQIISASQPAEPLF